MTDTLQVWFGIAFTSGLGQPTAARPYMPPWLRLMVANRSSADDILAELAGRGYFGDKLAWITWHDQYGAVHGLAVAESVQEIPVAAGIAEVNTTQVIEVEDRWAMSMGRAVNALGLWTAETHWYQSISLAS